MKKQKIVSLLTIAVFMFSMFPATIGIAASPFDQLQSAALGEDKFYMPVELVVTALIWSGPFNGTVQYIVYSSYEDSRRESFSNIMEDEGVVLSLGSYVATTGTYGGKAAVGKGDIVVVDQQTPVVSRANYKQFIVSENMNASFIATLVGDKLTTESQLINYTLTTVSARVPIPLKDQDTDGLGKQARGLVNWITGGLLSFNNELKAYKLVVGTTALDLFTPIQKEAKKGTLKSSTPDYFEFDITTEVSSGAINNFIEKGVSAFVETSTDRTQRFMLVAVAIVFFVVILPVLLYFIVWTKIKTMKAVRAVDKATGATKVIKSVRKELKP